MHDDLNRFRSGDEALWQALHARCHGRLMRLVRRLAPAADADDLVQDSWFVAFQRRHGLREFVRFDAWIARIARNVVLLHLRSGGSAARPPPDAPPVMIGETEMEESVSAAAELQPLAAAVREIVDRLPHGQRTIVLMYYWHHDSVREIAAQLGVAPGTVKATLSQARGRIRTLYLERTGTPAHGINRAGTGSRRSRDGVGTASTRS